MIPRPTAGDKVRDLIGGTVKEAEKAIEETTGTAEDVADAVSDLGADVLPAKE